MIKIGAKSQETAAELSVSHVLPQAWFQMRLGLLMLFLASFIIRFVCFTGIVASDDLGYSHYAQQIAKGLYNVEAHHFASRYGVIVPLATIYRFWGVHEWTTILLPLLMSSIAPILALLVAQRFLTRRAAWVTAILLATFPVHVRYATILVPEAMMETIVLTAVLLFLHARQNDNIAKGIIAGIAFGLAYLTKEPAIFVALAFLAYAGFERRWRLATTVVLGLSIVVLSEMVWYWSQTGDPFFRSHAMAIHNASGMAVAANDNLTYRLFKAYPRMMIVPNVDFGLHSTISVICLLAALFLRPIRGRAFLFPLILWAAVPFLYLNFGSSSFSKYWALPVAPRYIELVYVPLFCVFGAVFSSTIDKHGWRRHVGHIVVGVVCLTGVACATTTRGTGYHTPDVQRLKKVILSARIAGNGICDFSGSKAARWRAVVEILDSDLISCRGNYLRVSPDQQDLAVAMPAHP
jgi:4-amino-4-deoxy-L-arabinose transferase-like glycosyltransferase